MIYTKYTDRSEILAACEAVTMLEPQLDAILSEISTLKRGEVKPEDTVRRSGVGSYVSEQLQQIDNYVVKNNIVIPKRVKETIATLREKAEKVLRENVSLQTIPPLDFVRFSDIPVRYTYSFFGGREQRWGYGLHTKPFNEEGKSVTVALMPPHYVQTIHNHSLSEYCLIIGSQTEGLYYPGKKREKIYSTKNSEIFRFSATTPHTLRNASDRFVRNITFKDPKALFDWKSAANLHHKKIVKARIIKGELTVHDTEMTTKVYTIQDQYYDYKIIITKLAEGKVIRRTHAKDHFIFVVKGKLTISHKRIKKECSKHDFIVIDRNTEYTIKATTLCRIYELVL